MADSAALDPVTSSAQHLHLIKYPGDNGALMRDQYRISGQNQRRPYGAVNVTGMATSNIFVACFP